MILTKYLSEQVRAWIYRVILSAQPLVVFYGLLAEQEAALWVAVISSILGVSLAAANTSTAPSIEGEYDYLDDDVEDE
jgi:hypothetical protein